MDAPSTLWMLMSSHVRPWQMLAWSTVLPRHTLMTPSLPRGSACSAIPQVLPNVTFCCPLLPFAAHCCLLLLPNVFYCCLLLPFAAAHLCFLLLPIVALCKLPMVSCAIVLSCQALLHIAATPQGHTAFASCQYSVLVCRRSLSH